MDEYQEDPTRASANRLVQAEIDTVEDLITAWKALHSLSQHSDIKYANQASCSLISPQPDVLTV